MERSRVGRGASSRAVAVGQTVPVRGDVAANVAEHVRLARVAAAAGARAIVFPELSLTGYELDLAERLAFEPDDARLVPLRDVAAESGIALVAGAPVRIDGHLHIGAFLMGADGGCDVATKRHLGAFGPDANPGGAVPPAEASVFAPGGLAPLLRAGGVTSAVGICKDATVPGHPAEAARRGADTYLAAVFLPPADVAADVARLAGYAARHGMLVAMANSGGPSGGLPGGGGSGVWAPGGAEIVRLPPHGSGVAVALESRDGWCGAIPDA